MPRNYTGCILVSLEASTISRPHYKSLEHTALKTDWAGTSVSPSKYPSPIPDTIECETRQSSLHCDGGLQPLSGLCGRLSTPLAEHVWLSGAKNYIWLCTHWPGRLWTHISGQETAEVKNFPLARRHGTSSLTQQSRKLRQKDWQVQGHPGHTGRLKQLQLYSEILS